MARPVKRIGVLLDNCWKASAGCFLATAGIITTYAYVRKLLTRGILDDKVKSSNKQQTENVMQTQRKMVDIGKHQNNEKPVTEFSEEQIELSRMSHEIYTNSLKPGGIISHKEHFAMIQAIKDKIK